MKSDVIETQTRFEKIMNQTFDKSDLEGQVKTAYNLIRWIAPV